MNTMFNGMEPEEVEQEIRRTVKTYTYPNEEELYPMLWAVGNILPIKNSVTVDMFYEWFEKTGSNTITKERFSGYLSIIDEYFKVFNGRVAQSDNLKSYTGYLDEETIKELKKSLTKKELTDEERYQAAIDYLVKYADEVKYSDERHRLLCEMLCGGIQQKFGIHKFITVQEIGVAYRKAHESLT